MLAVRPVVLEKSEELSVMSEVAVPVKKRRPQIWQRPREITIPRYHVVLMDDDDHTYDYVIEMLMKLFGHSRERAFLMACEVTALAASSSIPPPKNAPS
jgi:hypothetical protein